MATSFSQAQFGKTIDQITEEDLVDYFSVERDESLTLEFKSYYAKEKLNLDGVLRTVTAFLNSEGGLLIFGAPPEVAIREKYRVVKGNPTPIPTGVTTKDSLVRSISDNISYMPIGYRIESVLMREGDFVYLVEVQESENKPYQYDKRYFIRLDGQSRPAPHYLVEALFKQVKAPELKGFMRVTSYRFEFSRSTQHGNKIHLQFDIGIYNETKSINDTGVYIQAIASAGRFIPNSQENYIFNGGLLFVKDASPVITYALATNCVIDYEIGSDEYIEFFRDGKVLEVSICFGSYKSITRRSDYYISFKNISMQEIMNNTYTRPLDLNSLMSIRKEENLSMNEVWQGPEEQRRQLSSKGI